MTTIPALNLPDSYTTMGAPAPDVAISGDGSVFYGVQTKIHNKTAYQYRVFHQQPSGAEARPIDTGILGQGQLKETGGLLLAVGYAAPGDLQHVLTFVVPGFVPARLVLPKDGAVARLFRGVYKPEDFDTPGEAALRVGKQLDALHELMAALGVVFG